MLLVAISVIPALALPSDTYSISDKDSNISVIVDVAELSTIEDVLVNGKDTTILTNKISNDGEKSRIFGQSGDDYFYIIYDLKSNSFKAKIWTDSETVRIISTPIVESLF